MISLINTLSTVIAMFSDINYLGGKKNKDTLVHKGNVSNKTFFYQKRNSGVPGLCSGLRLDS